MNVTMPEMTYGGHSVATCDDCEKIIYTSDRQDCLAYFDSCKCHDCYAAQEGMWEIYYCDK